MSEELVSGCSETARVNEIKERLSGFYIGPQTRSDIKFLLSLIDSRATAQEGMREALWAARVFIEDEYRDPSLEPEGEWLAKEARAIHSKICVALSAPAEPAGISERLHERAAIVAWLRNPAGKGSDDGVDFADDFADAIEAGRHSSLSAAAEPAGRELLVEARDALMAARELISLRRGSERDFTIPDYYESECFPSFDYRRHGSDDLDKWVSDLTFAALSKLRTALGDGK